MLVEQIGKLRNKVGVAAVLPLVLFAGAAAAGHVTGDQINECIDKITAIDVTVLEHKRPAAEQRVEDALQRKLDSAQGKLRAAKRKFRVGKHADGERKVEEALAALNDFYEKVNLLADAGKISEYSAGVLLFGTDGQPGNDDGGVDAAIDCVDGLLPAA
ncbi:MAG: hypothetical protein OEQ39_16345 [Gammaproteobacteria bacterium]|nr:hypothetical protein [Gammaproteobacteria bacterium]